MGATDDLRHAADAVSAKAKEAGGAVFDAPMRRLHQAAQRVGLAWCGSWLPGMANLYGQALQPATGGLPRPPEISGSGRIGWVEWAADDIRCSIHQAAGQPDVQQLLSHAARAALNFEGAKATSLPLLAAAVAAHGGDAVLGALQREVQQLRLVDHDSLLDSWRPSSKPASGAQRGRSGTADQCRDWEVPAHLCELAAIEALRSPLTALQTLASLLRRASEHCRSLLQQAAQAQQAARAQAGAVPPPTQAQTQAQTQPSVAPQHGPPALPLSFDALPPIAPAASAPKLRRVPAFARGEQAPLHQLVADSAVRGALHGAGAHAQ